MKTIVSLIIILGLGQTVFAEVTNYRTQVVKGQTSAANLDMEYINNSLLPKAAEEACQKQRFALMTQEIVNVEPPKTGTDQYVIHFDAICMGDKVQKAKTVMQRDPALLISESVKK